MKPIDLIIRTLENANHVGLSRMETLILSVMTREHAMRRTAGERPLFVIDLIRLTGLCEVTVRNAVRRLRKKGLVRSKATWFESRPTSLVWPTKEGVGIFTGTTEKRLAA